jgi:hypothetical protein
MERASAAAIGTAKKVSLAPTKTRINARAWRARRLLGFAESYERGLAASAMQTVIKRD